MERSEIAAAAFRAAPRSFVEPPHPHTHTQTPPTAHNCVPCFWQMRVICLCELPITCRTRDTYHSKWGCFPPLLLFLLSSSSFGVHVSADSHHRSPPAPRCTHTHPAISFPVQSQGPGPFLLLHCSSYHPPCHLFCLLSFLFSFILTRRHLRSHQQSTPFHFPNVCNPPTCTHTHTFSPCIPS